MRQRGLAGWVMVAGVAALSACGHVQSSLTPQSDESRAIARTWELSAWVAIPVLLLVLLALGLALWRNHGNGEGRTRDRNLWFSVLGVSVLGAGLLAVLAAQGDGQGRSPQGAATDPVDVRITARQWWWQIDYLDPDPARRFTTANELHLPVDRPTRIELRSGDVRHSLWIPVLDGAQDMVPGQAATITITPRKVGRYRGQCAQFCGVQHANMALDVRVDDAAGYAAWQTHQRAPPNAPTTRATIAGRAGFNTSCAACHAIGGGTVARQAGPDLTHLASRHALGAGATPLDRGTLETWIADPQRHKPGNLMPAVPLQPQQLSDVTDYLMSLD